MDTTAATYCIAAQGGTIGENRSHLLYRSPKGGPLVDITIASYCIAAQGGTIGGHYHGHLLYRSPRGDHWWTLPQPLTVSQPKGGPLVDITIASYCITAQGGTIGEYHDSQLLYRSPRGDHWWTSRYIASCCIAAQGGTIGGHYDSQVHCITAQGGTIGGHYRSHLLYHSPRGDHWWTLPQPVTVSQPKGRTIGGHYDSQLDFCITAPRQRGDHWYSAQAPAL